MNILLIHPKLGKRYFPRFPLGLGYIAAVLREGGHKVKAIDLNAQRELENVLSERIKSGKFDIIGLSAMITQFKEVKYLSSLIKNTTKTKIVLGGEIYWRSPGWFVVDFVVIGKADNSVIALANHLKTGSPIKFLA